MSLTSLIFGNANCSEFSERELFCQSCNGGVRLFTVEHDKEGGGPIKLKIEEASMAGFLSSWERGSWRFVAPCTFYSSGTSMQVCIPSPFGNAGDAMP
jgi:hypothetical protein